MTSPSSHHAGRSFDADTSGGRPSTPLPGPETYEEADRELAARAFVNAAADSLVRVALRNAKPKVCTACGITFLGFSDRDVLCHVDVGRPPR